VKGIAVGSTVVKATTQRVRYTILRGATTILVSVFSTA